MLVKLILAFFISGSFLINFNNLSYVSKTNNEEYKKILLIIDEENSKDSSTIKTKLKTKGFYNCSLIYSGNKNIFSIEVNDIDRAKTVLDNLDFVEHYEEDYILDFLDNDVGNNARTIPTDYASIINLQGAWNYTTGNSSVFVGVIDSGINASHPYLSGKVSTSLSKTFIPNETISPLTDTWGHGTSVAGIICSVPNSENSCIGVCQNIQLVSLKVKQSGSNTYASNVIAAIEYANDIKIPILNISTSWKENQISYNLSLKTAIQDYTGLVICSAGNEANDMDEQVNLKYPAGYNLDNVIVVGGSNSVDQIWNTSNNEGSNHSDTYVDLFAPGVDIEVLQSRYQDFGSYTKIVNGTSFSAPMVAGVAALLKSYRPSLTTSQIKDCIIYSVDKISVLNDKCETGGRLNAYKALSLAYHTHSYSYTNLNAIYHKKSCTGCHYYSTEEHVWTSTPGLLNNETEPNYIPGGYRCNICGAVKNNIL